MNSDPGVLNTGNSDLGIVNTGNSEYRKFGLGIMIRDFGEKQKIWVERRDWWCNEKQQTPS